MQKRARTARPVMVALGLLVVVTGLTAVPAATPVVSTPAAAVERTLPIARTSEAPEDLSREIAALIENCPGEPSVVIRLLDEDWRIAHDEDRVVKAASVIKLPILIAILRILERDGLDLEEKIPILAEDRTGGSGRLKSVRRNRPRTLVELLRLMIVESDNTATNAVIRRFGREEIDAEFAAMGLETTRLKHLILRSNEDNPTSARETADLIERLIDDGGAPEDLLPSPENRLLAFSLMEEAFNQRRLGRFLPPEARLRHKTGTLRSVVHDVGFFRTDRGEVLVAALISETSDQAGAEAWIARLGRAVHESLAGQVASEH